MSERNDGGPAFPGEPVYNNPNETLRPAHTGMSLREYFAAVAMQGLLAHGQSNGQPEAHAQYAFSIADAMLAESAK